MILLNDFQRQWAEIRQDVAAAFERVGASGWYILGREVEAFERKLAAWWGQPLAVGVANGLDAIELGLKALGCGPRDFVLTSPISAFATPLAIIRTGATPVFVDCDRYGLLDLDQARAVLHARPEIRYSVPVHLYGHAIDEGELRELRDRFELKIVEDCAQSIGAGTGAVGQCAATSFYPTKNLGAMGDGGAVLTADPQLAAKVRILRDYGQTAKYRHDYAGANSRLDELQAAILNDAMLPRLDGWIDARRKIAERYLTAIPASVGAPKRSSWHLFPILAESAAEKPRIRAALEEQGIATGEHYPLPLVEQQALAPYHGKMGSDCPRSREFCRREISLPIHPYLRPDEVEAVIEGVNRYFFLGTTNAVPGV